MFFRYVLVPDRCKCDVERERGIVVVVTTQFEVQPWPKFDIMQFYAKLNFVKLIEGKRWGLILANV